MDCIELFDECHHMVSTGMGGISVNLAHLPHPGTVMDQSAVLLHAFRVIKNEIYRAARQKLERKK